jgi:hypothetical protein
VSCLITQGGIIPFIYSGNLKAPSVDILAQIVLRYFINMKITINYRVKYPHKNEPFKDEAQTALFKDPVRTAL